MRFLGFQWAQSAKAQQGSPPGARRREFLPRHGKEFDCARKCVSIGFERAREREQDVSISPDARSHGGEIAVAEQTRDQTRGDCEQAPASIFPEECNNVICSRVLHGERQIFTPLKNVWRLSAQAQRFPDQVQLDSTVLGILQQQCGRLGAGRAQNRLENGFFCPVSARRSRTTKQRFRRPNSD